MKGARILIVEDEGIVAMELAHRVETMGYLVAAIVSTGEEARRIASTQELDLAIVDVRLKGAMTGPEAVMEIRRERDLPVIFLTAYADDDTLARIKECEPRGYLLKPFDERTLWVTIETALHTHEMAQRRAAAEKARHRSDALYAAILSHSHDAIISVDREQRITVFNSGAERMFGYTAKEAVGKPLDILIPESSLHAHRAVVSGFSRSADKARRMAEMREVQGCRKSGEVFPAEVSISRLEVDGELILTAVVRDMSEWCAMQRKVEQAERLDALGRLAGGIAHDFNNLLTGILGYARLLKSSLADDDTRARDVEEIQSAGERAARLINELLDYGRQQVLTPEETDVNALVTRLERLLRQMLGDRTRLESRLGTHVPAVLADPVKLDQVVMNLVLNARDAMSGGGTVKLETFAAAGDPSDDAARSWTVIRVSDTGVGMDPATQARLFEPFFSTKGELGHGLGLASSYGIVQQSGGEIRVRSELGKGSCFEVWLPSVGASLGVAKPAAGALGESPSLRAGASVQSVLLVDDEQLIRELGARVLREQGYEVFVAQDGGEALSFLRAHNGPLDVLVSDVVMPIMNGYDLAEQACALRPELRIVLMSAYHSEASRARSKAAPCVRRFLEKPFDPDALKRHVAELMRSSASC